MKKQRSIPVKYRIWKEGRYLDLWNLPHFIIGVLLGFILISYNVSFANSLLIVFFIKLAWEIYEHLHVVKETIPNKILDVLTGVLGFLSIYIFSLQHQLNFIGFVFVVIIEIILGLWGLYAMKKMDLFLKK